MYLNYPIVVRKTMIIIGFVTLANNISQGEQYLTYLIIIALKYLQKKGKVYTFIRRKGWILIDRKCVVYENGNPDR